ncbi:MAG: alkyl sulfatase dimerization domain-containing protein [Hyphomonadaceae bacterium]
MKTALLGFVSLFALGACATTEAPPAAPPQPAAIPQPVAMPVAMTGAEAPSRFTRAEHATVKAERNFTDARDFDFASRGFIATRKDPLITNAAGQTVWNLAAFDFLKDAAPETVNPSLWRQGQLMAKHGLFKVSDNIWQVRGFDLANITFVKGKTGWIVIDTLGSTETAKAAYDLVTEQLGARPITTVIYTHSHSDHFAGTAGIVNLEDVKAGKVAVIAPKGFLEAAVGENVIAGPAMQRRALYQFGIPLPKGADGLVNAGIGPGIASGSSSLIPPTKEIAATGETMTIDGVKLVFQFTPGTEAPAEMNIDFPDWKIVDMAENANATQHNILTPRGAVVRDAKVWAEGLTKALRIFGDSDVLITSHGWPRFGNDTIRDYLGKHRDAYAFLHDQTVRLMNQGLNGDEIAAKLKLPAELDREWYDRPYYGSFSFNARAVYQFYMGWYDANPSNLAPMPPVETGKRYVAAMGGATHVYEMAKSSYDKGDYAWAAELLNHVIMADNTNAAAKDLLARCYDQLGWQAEPSTWRNIYLTGAKELRDGVSPPRGTPAAQMASLANLPLGQLIDLLSVRLNPEKSAGQSVKLAFVLSDSKEQTLITIANGVLVHEEIAAPGPVDATLTLSRADFLGGIFGGQPLPPKIASGAAKLTGNPQAMLKLGQWMDPPNPVFPIVSR